MQSRFQAWEVQSVDQGSPPDIDGGFPESGDFVPEYMVHKNSLGYFGGYEDVDAYLQSRSRWTGAVQNK
ncbi:uncharacterized protein SPPG_06426 [Spizellomyces punctatus DAOM BR117]|uniref:Uncharacterized protein n=1 Tax=Spizellomyces punctatus (strain DAOM BR117) TaxID=645134 RepID=A0A0L0H9Z7_SPIPD|nr:uncharacterized protein SPPG_06426 [Spizellomyces punctatus DAOM BR117]KNC98007.1 hypothetical protein SPPG_06426 [Spizellomyces punctatus DAOM BR117]|eukprot:XP_016606047.1 hypothetical protein SPPG_06426 [Spizellomyces punctatus DAOM BR117]